MSKLWKAKKVEDNPGQLDKAEKVRPVKIEKPTEPTRLPRKGKAEDLDNVTELMRKLKLSQLEAQRKVEEKLSFMRDVFTKMTPAPAPAAPAPYYSPNQYGNRDYPPAGNRTNVRGCNWDGLPHGRDTCEELQKALNRGEVHRKGKVLYMPVHSRKRRRKRRG